MSAKSITGAALIVIMVVIGVFVAGWLQKKTTTAT